ncbi:MAG: response regulator [Anaerolineae bacterium]|nr:response regulator [Anaerolineae bacterium]
MNILIVDDSQVIQRVLSMQLRKNGYAVTVASSAREALELLEQEHVDLAIMDIAMPEVDGLTLLRQVRADPRFQKLPVIMLTASGQDQDRITAREAGANDFLSKPTSSRELLDAVQRLLA